MKKLAIFTLLIALILSPPSFAADDDHGHGEESHAEEKVDSHDDHDNHADEKKEEEDDGHGHGGGGHDDEEEGDGSVELTPESIKEAGIIVEPLTLQNLENELNAPGEVKLNSYLSSKITPRIVAQVVARHIKLGDEVKKNQPLVTLSSVEVATAVGEFLVAQKEWERVEKLGKRAVSAKRYNEAKVADTQTKAKIIAYGISESQLELYKKGSSKTTGSFQLVAPQDGIIVSDDFIVGELIEPGRILFNIVNEDILWVESYLSPKQSGDINIGANARVYVPNNGWLQGKVIQKHHMLDEETRTMAIRIEVNNEADKLHPGMYVDTKIQMGKGKKYLAAPTEAVLRNPDGDWAVFVEQDEAGHFKPIEIEVVKVIDDYTVIKGIEEGTRIVTIGAFFVQSELAKSGFSVHNH